MTATATEPRRTELILRQIDALPTLPAIAMRLLSLTTGEESHAREVIELVRADPALTAKVLALCRTADRGVRDETLTVDRAVILLGFTAVRNAVLSVKVFEAFGRSDEATDRQSEGTGRMPGHGEKVGEGGPRLPSSDEGPDASSHFSPSEFWYHSLAVAVLAERIAAAHPDSQLKPGEAFTCGLLHDVGKLALNHVLPKSFARVVELTRTNQANIAEFERRVMGLDHHTAGKRLARQWQLPSPLVDCIWLHGSAYETLPTLPHRRLIGLVGLADLLARQAHVGWSGNFTFPQQPDPLAEKIALDPATVRHATQDLHEELDRRGRVLGLDERPSRELFLSSIQRANQTLGRMNQTLQQRSRTSAQQGRVLDAIRGFHATAAPDRTVQDVLDAVAGSAHRTFGPGFYALLHACDPDAQPEGEARGPWLMSQYGTDGRLWRSQYIEPPPQAPDLSGLDAHQPVGMDLMGLLPWLADYLLDAPDLRQVRLLPLACGWGTAAVLLHDREQPGPWNQLEALTRTWGAAIAAAARQEASARLGEQLAEANSALAEAQDRLLRQESMARLGEMAAGAAHEMNNPLAVISGRSQLLTLALQPGGREQTAAQAIHQAAHRLSDMITALRLFADPPQPQRAPLDLGEVLEEAIRKARAEAGERTGPNVDLRLKQDLPMLDLDREQLSAAVAALVLNAIQSNPRTGVQVLAQGGAGAPGESVINGNENGNGGPDPISDAPNPVDRSDSCRILIQVFDDGVGMDERTRAHAMDPFFSAKPAGRQAGLGLPRARQWIAGHGGTLELRSTPGRGTTATITLSLEG